MTLIIDITPLHCWLIIDIDIDITPLMPHYWYYATLLITPHITPLFIAIDDIT
jgi:hypothetical protein